MVSAGAGRSEARSPLDGLRRDTPAPPGWRAPPLPRGGSTRRNRPRPLVRHPPNPWRSACYRHFRRKVHDECVTDAGRPTSCPTPSGPASRPVRRSAAIALCRAPRSTFRASRVGAPGDDGAPRHPRGVTELAARAHPGWADPGARAAGSRLPCSPAARARRRPRREAAPIPNWRCDPVR